MNLQRSTASFFMLFFIVFFSFQTAHAEDAVDLREQAKSFYYEIIKINTTGSLNLAPLLSLLDPKVTVTHQGPKSVYAPFYKTYKPLGCVPYSAFMAWVLDLMRSTTIVTFCPETSSLLSSIDVGDYNRYMIVDGNVVYSHVLEGGNILRYNFLDLSQMIIEDTEWGIDNMHLLTFNDKGLIEKIEIVSESEGYMNAVDNIPSSISDVIDSQANNIPVDGYLFDVWHNKGMAAMFVGQLSDGILFDPDTMMSDDVVCELPGNAPFAGVFSGKIQVEEFIALFSEEITAISITEIVGEYNKAAVKCRIEGENSITGASFVSEMAVFSFQFDSEGRIVSIKLNYDTYAVIEAY